ncbi:MAG TPA: S8 family serine peptidase [Pyrinomonadaceae bacterium]|jgi:hypothetical protein
MMKAKMLMVFFRGFANRAASHHSEIRLRCSELARCKPLRVVRHGLTLTIIGISVMAVDTEIPKALSEAGPTRHRSKLFKDSRRELAFARAERRRDVTLLVAAVPGGVAAVAGQAVKLGGDVLYRDNDIDYLRIRVPIDRVNEFVESESIEAVALDIHGGYFEGLENLDASIEPSVANEDTNSSARPTASALQNGLTSPDTEPWPPKWSDYPLRHPYSPLRDIDAAEFLARHPTFDGRGVTVAHVEDTPDLLLPEFQAAYTLDGGRVPKVADVVNSIDPREDDAQAMWVDMNAEVESQNHRLLFQHKSFITPHDGSFRVGFFHYRQALSAHASIIDRVGSSQVDKEVLGVLWDEQSNEVWVDTNRNLDFSDEKAMTDYRKRQDVGVFGQDDPATAVRESIGFTVSMDLKNRFVSINRGIDGHNTSVLGCIIGNREPRGRIQGIAPGARVVFVEESAAGSDHANIEGIIAAFKHPDVDLISTSSGDISKHYPLADTRHPASVIIRRLTQYYPQKLFFVSGGNWPGFGLVAEDGAASSAMSVGAYQSQESYRVNEGFIPEGYDHLHAGRSHGPGGNGALKPDLLAPAGQISTYVGFSDNSKSSVSRVRGLYQLPQGYGLGTGTSTAGPMAAGAAALVVSAAKQTHVPFTAATLKAALVGSARYISTLKANEQGNGLIQVEAAYELLKKLARTPLITIDSHAPVRTKMSQWLETPNEGVGIYEREGWSVGEQGTRSITFKRTSGPVEPMTFSLSWQGNDGTFSSGSSVVLALNQSVEVLVEITIKEVGAHSALLTLDHPSVPGHAYRVLNTVVAPLRFTREDNYTITTELSVPLPDDRAIFVEVPQGVGALKCAASGGNDAVVLNVWSPMREAPAPLLRGEARPDQRQIEHPEPGVWEINASFEGLDFDPNRPQPAKPIKVKVTASLVGIGLVADMPASTAINPGGSFDMPVRLMNRFAPVSASVSAFALGSAFKTKREIEQGEQHMYEVMVPEGATLLYTRVSDVADTRADLDVYLVDCTALAENHRCVKYEPRRKATTADPGGEVEVRNPAPGLWKIVVDAYSVPSGRTTYSYLDVFTHPRFGSLTATDTLEKRGPGDTWTTTAHAWIANLPEAPRILQIRIIATGLDVKARDNNLVPLGSLDFLLPPL